MSLKYEPASEPLQAQLGWSQGRGQGQLERKAEGGDAQGYLTHKKNGAEPHPGIMCALRLEGGGVLRVDAGCAPHLYWSFIERYLAHKKQRPPLGPP